jgi:hypothetical protein
VKNPGKLRYLSRKTEQYHIAEKKDEKTGQIINEKTRIDPVQAFLIPYLRLLH